MKPFTKISSFAMALVAIAHLTRVIWQTEIVIGCYSLPQWISMLGFIAASILTIGLWRESK